ncbi:hypothetical protein T265_11330 [Opisthorchis viverrini]|uniref:MD-2-related lipid-recognition domain-containing protein n=1 Tax=Opisthorchis viverrini TaxID=6198 RepID=A0A074ZXV8_OPIVI|nr:hypothetical protein T265_11330 [Opisthorchis viverrini]KER20029.1 hypothetical protein T265_11330 [Opisthorchis viverrini]
MARECSSAPYFCFFSFHTISPRPSETMLTSITVARRSRTAIRSGLMNDVEVGVLNSSKTMHPSRRRRFAKGPNPTSTSRLPLSRLGRPGCIPALVPPSCGMVAWHRKGATAERLLYYYLLFQSLLHEDLSSTGAGVTQVEIIPCDGEPCALTRAVNYIVRTAFVAYPCSAFSALTVSTDANVESRGFTVRGTIGSQPLTIPAPINGLCFHVFPRCPIEAGKSYVYGYTGAVPPNFPLKTQRRQETRERISGSMVLHRCIELDPIYAPLGAKDQHLNRNTQGGSNIGFTNKETRNSLEAHQ